MEDIRKFNGKIIGFDPVGIKYSIDREIFTKGGSPLVLGMKKLIPQCFLHELQNSEDYLYKIFPNGNFGLLGQEAIELVNNATSLLQFISFEKCKQANLSVEWEMFCDTE